jgi:hypothetical protein
MINNPNPEYFRVETRQVETCHKPSQCACGGQFVKTTGQVTQCNLPRGAKNHGSWSTTSCILCGATPAASASVIVQTQWTITDFIGNHLRNGVAGTEIEAIKAINQCFKALAQEDDEGTGDW